MANKYKNEMEIKLGAEVILLRPSFENISDMESNVGGVTYLAWKFSRGSTLSSTTEKLKSLPTLSDITKIIYYNQAARKLDDPTLRKLSLEEVWVMVQDEGVRVIGPVTTYLTLIMAGNKGLEESSDTGEKKS